MIHKKFDSDIVLLTVETIFQKDGLQIYLAFQTVLPDVIIKPSVTSDNNFNPKLNFFNNSKFPLELNGGW